MAVEALTLVSNPGSASRKYALFRGTTLLADLHYEHSEHKGFECTVITPGSNTTISVDIHKIGDAVRSLPGILAAHELQIDTSAIRSIGLRIVAPSSYFLTHRKFDAETIAKLRAVHDRAPLHVAAALAEHDTLQREFPEAQIFAISDSAFHQTKPDYAWNYGLPLADADRYDIKRFGYHGLSVASSVRQLQKLDKLAPKIVICHLGSGCSVTAVWHGKSLDTTMGFSPLEGPVMATRSGTIDPAAGFVLKQHLKLTDQGMEKYLNSEGGLLGLSGLSWDLRELLEAEPHNHAVQLALGTFVHTIQKAIGSMCAAMNGLDVLVFTGTIGERAPEMRKRIADKLDYLDVQLDPKHNQLVSVEHPEQIGKLAHSKPVFVIHANENAEIARQVKQLT